MNRAEECARSETLAAQYLEGKGYKILGKNLLFPGVGELDIVLKDGNTLVIVEVRYRSSEAMGHPFETVDKKKMQKTIRATEWYIEDSKVSFSDVRFDLIAVTYDKIEHLEDAFYGKLLR